MEEYRPGTCFVRFLGGSAVHDWRWVGDWLGIEENGGKQVPGGKSEGAEGIQTRTGEVSRGFGERK